MNYGYVYKTTNILNNKVYVGQKQGNFNSNYFGSGNYIKRAINKYGRAEFKLEIIVYAEDKNKLDELEKQYIAEYREKFGKDNCYNIGDGGEGLANVPEVIEKIRQSIIKSYIGRVGPNKGKKCSLEERQHMSKSHLGKKRSVEALRKFSATMKGRKCGPMSAEHKQNISKSLMGNKRALGHKCSLEARQNMSISQRRRFDDLKIKV